MGLYTRFLDKKDLDTIRKFVEIPTRGLAKFGIKRGFPDLSENHILDIQIARLH